MSDSSTSVTPGNRVPPGTPAAPSTGELVAKVSEQLSTLVRDELRLARTELTAKGKKAGLGAGLFGGAGVVAWFGVGALVAAAILGLSTALAGWLAALIVGVALLLVAGGFALTGKREISAATPAAPTEALSGIKQDVRTVKESAHR